MPAFWSLLSITYVVYRLTSRPLEVHLSSVLDCIVLHGKVLRCPAIDSPGKERLASPFILICLSDLSFRLISAFTSLSLAYFMVILEARESGEWEWTPVMEVSMSCKS